MKKITLLFLFVLVGMQAFAQPSTITITAPTDATSVRITGPWWEWNPTGGPIATLNPDGTWLISLTSGAGAMEYLIVVDGVQENLIDNSQGGECTARVDAGNIVTDSSNYANRKWLPTDGVDYSETYDDCSQMVFPDTDISTPVTLPLDFSDDNQLFTYVGNSEGGSVVMEAGKMRFNGNGHIYDNAYLDLTSTFSLMDAANNTFTITMDPLLVPAGEERTHLIKASIGIGAAVELTGKSIGSGVQDVTFNFGAMGAEPWDRITIFMDFNTDKVTDYLISSITLGADPAATCTDGIQNGDETGVDCGGSCDEQCIVIALPLDFSDDNQLFTYVGNGEGGSVVMEAGKMRFNGNGHIYDNAYLDLTSTFSLMDAANNTFTITMDPLLVPAGEERTHLIKASIGIGAAVELTGKSIGSGVQDVTFNFGAMGAEPWDRITIFMDFNTDKVTDYLISSITLGADPVEPEVLPTTAAPSPTNSDVTILSIYNDTGSFTGVSQEWTQEYDFGTNQGNRDLDATDGVNNALKMDFSLSGWGAGAAIRDISNQTHLHFDYFAPAGDAGTNGHEFKFIIIGDGQGEKDYFFKTTGGDAVIEFDQWVSVDIPLSHYEALGFTKDKFLQYKLGSTSVLNTKVVYFDNIYFYNEANLGLDSSNALSMSLYPNPAKGSLNISAQNKIESATIYNVLGKKIKSFTVNAKTSSLDVSGLSRGIYILKYTANNAVGSMKFIKE